MTNTPESTPPFTIENWPPEPEQITEENISRWLDDIAFGIALPESGASSIFRAVRDYHHYSDLDRDLDLSEAGQYKLMCLHLMVAYAKLENQMRDVLANQVYNSPINPESL